VFGKNSLCIKITIVQLPGRNTGKPVQCARPEHHLEDEKIPADIPVGNFILLAHYHSFEIGYFFTTVHIFYGLGITWVKAEAMLRPGWVRFIGQVGNTGKYKLHYAVHPHKFGEARARCKFR
jgi:hypothetical protein